MNFQAYLDGAIFLQAECHNITSSSLSLPSNSFPLERARSPRACFPPCLAIYLSFKCPDLWQASINAVNLWRRIELSSTEGRPDGRQVSVSPALHSSVWKRCDIPEQELLRLSATQEAPSR